MKIPSIGSEIALAEKSLGKGKYIEAANHYYNVAEVYIKDEDDPETAKTYFIKAVETHLQNENYNRFTDFVKKSVKRLFNSPWTQIELLKDAASKLLLVRELKNAAKLVLEIGALYKKKPIQNSEKARYYEILAPQIRAGLLKEID
ncbi:MAG: hypothetical protein ACTSQI_07945 [Candidatus Helarchaeota archaeon]